jgi:multiple sugar transport system permease protein
LAKNRKNNETVELSQEEQLFQQEIEKNENLKTKITRPYTLIILPAIIITILFLIPFFWGIALSFTSYRLNDPRYVFNWGINYWNIISGARFWKTTFITFQYTFFVVGSQLILGFIIAMLLNTETFMAKILRKVIVFPLMIAPILATILLKLMLNNQFGVINYLLSFIGLGDFPWGASPATSMLTVVLVDVWIFTPFIIVIILAGLRALPKDPYEAAAVDGAKGFTVLKNITMPIIMPAVLVAVIFRIIDSIKVFDIVWGMTSGGPGDSTTVYSVLGYNLTFGSLNVARGTTIMVVVWIIILILGQKLVQYWSKVRSRLGN